MKMTWEYLGMNTEFAFDNAVSYFTRVLSWENNGNYYHIIMSQSAAEYQLI